MRLPTTVIRRPRRASVARGFTLVEAAMVLVIAYHPPAFFFAVTVLYGLSGPLGWLTGRLRRRPPASTPNASA